MEFIDKRVDVHSVEGLAEVAEVQGDDSGALGGELIG